MPKPKTKPTALTAATFDQAIEDHPVVLVDFWATWCGPCKTMAPDLEAVAAESGDDVLVAKVDVDKNPELVERFRIQSMPTIITFREGVMHRSYVGAVPAAGLWAAIDEASKPPRKGLFANLFNR